MKTNAFAKSLCLSIVWAITVVGLTPLAHTSLVNHAMAACKDEANAEVNWQNCRKRNMIMKGLNLEKADLSSASLISTDFSNSNFKGADFTKATLMRARLRSIEGNDADFTKVVGTRVNFESSDLTAANFSKAELTRVRFAGAILKDTNFEKSEIGRANFQGAILGGNDFSFAVVARADFRNARIQGSLNMESAYTFQTRFEGVDMSKFTGITQWQIELSCGDDKTILPSGLTASKNWPCTGLDED